MYTIRNPVVHVKDPLDPKRNVVWYMRIEEFGQLYVGEMERFLGESQRAQEHDKSVKEGVSKSALSQHEVTTGHQVLSKPVIEGVSVIDSKPRNMHVEK